LRESVLEVWKNRQTEIEEFKEIRLNRKLRIEERKQRLIEAFVYQQALDPETYRCEIDRNLCRARRAQRQAAVERIRLEASAAPAEGAVSRGSPKWCPQRDSNPCCQLERLES
jgi:outer membrane biogenesis lipoprotein LolB